MEAHQDESKNSENIDPLQQLFSRRGRRHHQQANNEYFKFSIEWTNITGTYLQHLNEDCLREIFSVKSLNVMDLCSLADTCTRFQQIIQRVFPKDLSIEIGDNGYVVDSRKYKGNRYGNRPSQDMDKLLTNFGSSVSEISIIGNDKEDEELSNFTLNLVTQYCVATLESLRLDRIDIPGIRIIKCKPSWKRLQLLVLKNVVIECGSALFEGMDSLIELRVHGIDRCSAILTNIFCKLERFTCQDNNFRIHHLLSTFFSRHPGLKTLNTSAWSTDESEFFQLIVNSCKELEELSLYIGSKDLSTFLQPLQALQSLNNLTLRFASFENFTFISALTKLRELHLMDCSLPADSKDFDLLFQLTKLHIIRGNISRSLDVVDIIGRLTNLDELTVTGMWQEFVLDKATFTKIVDVVKWRLKVLTLTCKINSGFNAKICDQYRMVVLREAKY